MLQGRWERRVLVLHSGVEEVGGQEEAGRARGSGKCQEDARMWCQTGREGKPLSPDVRESGHQGSDTTSLVQGHTTLKGGRVGI